VHHDNGLEFEGKFKQECENLGIEQVYSRPHTPKDNPLVKRFNRTIQEEWLEVTDVNLKNIKEANQELTEWLKEYNIYRPHQSLDYHSTLKYLEKVLPMSPASTNDSKNSRNLLILLRCESSIIALYMKVILELTPLVFN